MLPRQIGERAGPDRGEQRRAVRRPFLSVHRADRHAVNVGLQLTDERTLRPSTGEQQLRRRKPELLQDRQRVPKRERDPLEHRARQVRARVCEAEPEKRAARGCVAMRRPLALQIRKKCHAIGARRNARRFRIEHRVRIRRPGRARARTDRDTRRMHRRPRARRP